MGLAERIIFGIIKKRRQETSQTTTIPSETLQTPSPTPIPQPAPTPSSSSGDGGTSPETTGGFQLITGEEVLVTPSGQIVGSTSSRDIPSDLPSPSPTRIEQDVGSAIPGSPFFFVTPEEKEKLKGKDIDAFAITSPSDRFFATEAGVIASSLGRGIPSPTQFFGFIPFGEREAARARKADIETIFGIRQEQLSEIAEIGESFRKDPESFAGKPGFQRVESPKGTEFTLGSEFFETLPSSQRLKEFFPKDDIFVPKTKPRTTPGLRDIPSVAVGSGRFLGQVALDAVEFPFEATASFLAGGVIQESRARGISREKGLFGFQKVDIKGEEFLPSGLREPIAEFRSRESSVAEIVGAGVIASPLVAFVAKRGISSVREKGVGVAAAEVAGGLAPIRLKGGLFALEASAFKEFAFKGAISEGRTGALTVGSSLDEIVIGSRSGRVTRFGAEVSQDFSKGTVTKAVSITDFPAISVKAGGGLVDFGVLSIVEKDLFFSSAKGSAKLVRGFSGGQLRFDFGEGDIAGTGISFAQPRFGLFQGERFSQVFRFDTRRFSAGFFGGVSRKETDLITKTIGGRAFKSESFLGRTTKVSARTDVTRVDINLDDLFGKLSGFKPGRTGKGSSIFSAAKDSGLTDFSQIQKQISKSISPTVAPKPPRIEQASEIRPVSAFAGLGLYERSESLFLTQPLAPQGLEQKDFFKVFSLTKTVPSFRESQSGSLGFRSKADLAAAQSFRLRIEQAAGFQQRLKTDLKLDVPLKSDFRFPISPRFNFRVPGGFFFPLPIPGFSFSEGFKTPLKPRRSFKRVPSLLAVVPEIDFPFASKPLSGEITGIIARPRIRKKRRR